MRDVVGFRVRSRIDDLAEKFVFRNNGDLFLGWLELFPAVVNNVALRSEFHFGTLRRSILSLQFRLGDTSFRTLLDLERLGSHASSVQIHTKTAGIDDLPAWGFGGD